MANKLTKDIIFDGNKSATAKTINVVNGETIKIQAEIPSGQTFSYTVMAKFSNEYSQFHPIAVFRDSDMEKAETVSSTDTYECDVVAYDAITIQTSGTIKDVKIGVKLIID